MARMYPDFVEMSERVSSAEFELYHALREQLPNEFLVFHSVAWHAKDKYGKPQDGETDFVIAHPDEGILVIEVKGGNIRYTPQTASWQSVSEGAKAYDIKDPFVQARKAKYTLIELLNRVMGGRQRVRDINIGHAVAFPNVVIDESVLGPDKPRNVILDMLDATYLEGWVRGAMAYWRGEAKTATSAPGRRLMSGLIKLLGKSRELRPAMWGEIVRERQEMVRLTEEQYFVLDMLSRQRRAAIAGCAGSGKTLLAMEKAVRLAESGFKVLLTCYNKNLVGYLRRRIGNHPNIDIRNFHKLCFDMAREANMLPLQSGDQARFYDELLPEALLESAEMLNRKYDAIVVDEGQDFQETWWIPLQTLLEDPDDGILYIFYDENQAIYKGQHSSLRLHPSSLPIETPPFYLTINCRNTRTIHKQVARFYQADDASQARGPIGRPVNVTRYRRPEQLNAALSDTIRHLTHREKIPLNEITILTPLSRRNSNLWLSDGFRGVRYTDQLPTRPDQVHCNTIHAFKGLESSVVILAEVDQWSNRPKDLDPLLYVACSRAKNHLVVLLPESAPASVHHRFAA